VDWIKLTPGRRTEQLQLLHPIALAQLQLGLQLGLQQLWQWRCGGHLADAQPRHPSYRDLAEALSDLKQAIPWRGC
jgi:hypothetical protein